jgi:glycerophosphoryl diester phosphodiesterase
VAPTAAIAEVAHDHGLLAFGWDAQRMATLRRLLGYGLDAVYSDHVDRLVATTGRRATRSEDGVSGDVKATRGEPR